MSDLAALDWDNVRVFLAAVRTHSLRGAADALGLSHPTARRRLGALEEQLGLQLFERRRDGLHLTLEASDLQHAAEEVERAVQGLSRAAHAADPALRGPVRVTVPALAASDLFMPDFVAFARRWPQIDLQIDSSYSLADLDRREADVAIRFMAHGTRPAEHLTGRMAGTVYSATYGQGDQWIGWRGPAEDRSWIEESDFPELPSRGKMNEPTLQRAACAAGMGLTILPCFYAEPMLKRRTKPVPRFDLWVLVHPDLRRSPRLRVFRDAIVAAAKRLRPRLEGRTRTRKAKG